MALGRSLSGLEAHLALAPRPRRGWQPGRVPSKARIAAVLVLLYPNSNKANLLLTVRSGQLTNHAGQVSLPGGCLESGETVSEAALRETDEEVGINPMQVRILGNLSTLYVPASGFALHPVVGVMDERPVLRLASNNEVDRILEIPLGTFLTTAGPYRGYRWHDNLQYKVPYFELGGERVWGATAMVISELLNILGISMQHPWDKNCDSKVELRRRDPN